jgi:phosphohistidine phosphatase
MLRLLLLRHAKATRKDGPFEDFDRPLTLDGWEEARRIGAFIAEEHAPDLVVASASRRTRETLAALLSSTGHELACRLDRDLYEAGVDDLLGFTAEAGADASTVLLIGHNPTVEEAIRYLSWPGDPGVAAASSAGLPTGGLAIFEFDATDWRDTRAGQGHLLLTQFPRQLPASQPAPKD